MQRAARLRARLTTFGIGSRHHADKLGSEQATLRWSKFSSERILLGIRRYLQALGACVKFMMVFPWIRPKLTNRFSHGVLALQDDLTYANPAIPSIKPSKLFPGIEETEINLGRMLPRDGSSMSFEEMVVLCSIVKLERAQRVFEIGTSSGVTAFNIALNLPPDGVVFTLDLPPVSDAAGAIDLTYRVTISDRKMIFADRQDRRFLRSSVEEKVRQLYGDSASFDYTPYLGSCDLVFVDGSHARAYVEADTSTAFRLVRPGGIVVWHDCNDGHFWPDVANYLTELGRTHTLHRIRGTSFASARIPAFAKLQTRG